MGDRLLSCHRALDHEAPRFGANEFELCTGAYNGEGFLNFKNDNAVAEKLSSHRAHASLLVHLVGALKFPGEYKSSRVIGLLAINRPRKGIVLILSEDNSPAGCGWLEVTDGWPATNLQQAVVEP